MCAALYTWTRGEKFPMFRKVFHIRTLRTLRIYIRFNMLLINALNFPRD